MKKYIKNHRVNFQSALVSIFISNLFAVILQFFKGDVLDHAVAGNIQPAIENAVLLIILILCEVFAYFFHQLFGAKFVIGCTKDLKHDIFAGILQRDYLSYKQQTQGEYIAKYANEADTIRERLFCMLPRFWDIFSKIVFVSIGLFLLDWKIAVITIALLTTPLYIPKFIEKKLQNAQTAWIQAMEENLTKVNNWLSGFEIIKNYSIENKVMERFRSVNNKSMDTLLDNTQLEAVSQLITTLISYLSYFLVLVCAAWLILGGNFSAGDFFVAISMIDQLSYPLISLAAVIHQLIAVRPICVSMEQFLDFSGHKRSNVALCGIHSNITFTDVSFAYGKQHPIIEGFNLTIQKGRRYLFKGPSGCGKTTTVNLLLRYFDVTDGSIEVDGIPLTCFDSTYNCITAVRQDAVLFHDTLRNNLTMYQDIPEYRIFEVLRSVGLGKYCNADALDHLVCENGSNFSGGERKRICLARALLRDTDVLILDEPLANLDPETADCIENLILSISGKTIILISHVFSEEKLTAFHKVVDFSSTH